MNDSMCAEYASIAAVDDPGFIGTEITVGDQVFSADQWRQKIWPRRCAGPMTAVMAEFIDWLLVQGYAPLTQRKHVRAAARLGSWMTEAGVGLDGLDPDRVRLMVAQDNQRHPKHRSANENISAVMRFLQQTGRVPAAATVEVPTGPVQVCLAAWARFLAQEQEQGPSWIGKARSFGEGFLRLIEDEQGQLAWGQVDAAMANEFLARAVAGYSSSTAQSMAALLRGLLTWAAAQGWISDTIASGVLSARRVRPDLPVAMRSAELAALKRAVDLTNPTGLRDAAIIAMLSRLGIRAGEVADLSLDDIDWRRSSLQVTGKGGRVLVLPMPADLGQVLVDYLRVRRADPGERGVFIRSMPPLTALSRTGISNVVTKYARLAGLEGVYAHRLRHTLASQVLSAGGTIRQVSELLGHTDPASAMSYARVDMAPLRGMAPPWGRLP